MQFTKMQGLGNNYIFFNLLEEPMEDIDFSELSKQISDKNFGIGSDGIILICPSKSADFKMRIFNADGSEGKTCGNGLRCVAKYLSDHMYTDLSAFDIETLAGNATVMVEGNGTRKVRFVTVDMGEPKLLKGEIPMLGDPSSTSINEALTIGGESYHLTCVSMGNPHAILFTDDIKGVPLEKIGPVIEHADLFPDRVNVGIVHVKNRREIEYRVWERGSGITMACGSGACAAVVASTLNNLIDKHAPITVHLPGGDLTVTWDKNNRVWKRGEAAYICNGDFILNKK